MKIAKIEFWGQNKGGNSNLWEKYQSNFQVEEVGIPQVTPTRGNNGIYAYTYYTWW